MRLFHRFLLILLAFSLLPVAGMGLWMLSTRRAVQDNARFLHGRLAVLVADSAERTLEQMNRTLGVVQDLQIAGRQEKIEVPALRRAAVADSDVALLAILDAFGRETQRMSDPALFPGQAREDRSGDPLVAAVRSSGRLTIGAARVVAGTTLIPVIHPLADGRALYMMYSLSGLRRRLQPFLAGGRGRILFVDAGGKPVPGLGSDPPDAGWTLPASSADRDWWDDLPAPEGPWVAAVAPVPTLGWRAVSLQPRRDAYAESEEEALRAALLLVVLCGVVAGGAFGISKRMLKPLTALIAAAERVAAGDFSRPLPALGWGELDGLGKTFNAMAKKIAGYQELQLERILEEKAKIDALVRNIPEGVLLVGFDGGIAFANATAVRVISGGSAARVADFARAPEIRRIVETVMRGAKRVDETRVVARGDGGAPATFACLALPVVREEREIGVLVLMRDVTVELEIARMKDEFFHAVVHDLRGPITVIDGMVHFMKARQLEERESRYVEMARKASARLAELISNILDIAKLESGTMKLEPVKFSAESLLAGVLEISRVPADGKGVALETAASSPGELVGDAKLLDRVLMNLVGNALKFTPSGGRITIGAAGAGEQVEFFVRDTGPGIPADKVDAVFEKFKQLDRDAAARAGYGLGLSICKKIVEVHGGRIWVESQEGQGSRFAFRVPRAGPPAGEARPA